MMKNFKKAWKKHAAALLCMGASTAIPHQVKAQTQDLTVYNISLPAFNETFGQYYGYTPWNSDPANGTNFNLLMVLDIPGGWSGEISAPAYGNPGLNTNLIDYFDLSTGTFDISSNMSGVSLVDLDLTINDGLITDWDVTDFSSVGEIAGYGDDKDVYGVASDTTSGNPQVGYAQIYSAYSGPPVTFNQIFSVPEPSDTGLFALSVASAGLYLMQRRRQNKAKILLGPTG